MFQAARAVRGATARAGFQGSLAGAIVPKSPLVSPFGPAAKYSVSELEPRPPPKVSVHSPSITTGFPWPS